MKVQVFKKEEEKRQPMSKEKWREMVHEKEFIHHPPKIFTLAHLDQGS